MNKLGYFLVCSLVLLCTNACSVDKKESNETEIQSDSSSAAQQETTGTATSRTSQHMNTFDINSIPKTTKDIGVFPFFTAPRGYEFEYRGKDGTSEYDRGYFAINDTMLLGVEGRSFKAEINHENYPDYSALFIQNSFDKLIKDLGGVEVFSGEVNSDKFKEQLEAENGLQYSMWDHGTGQRKNVATYVIRKDDAEIYIQVTSWNEREGTLTIVQKGELEQTIGLITASEMKNELDSKGFIALYINFDTDKATIKPESDPIVDEIYNLLKDNSGLKVSINGHTDNVGSADHNQKLSEERAKSVADALIKKGIATSRLQSKGFGQNEPIGDNRTEEGKAKNRRVEIVKMK